MSSDVFLARTVLVHRGRPMRRAVFRLAAGLAVGAVLFFLLLPTLLVIPMSLSSTDYIRLPPAGLTLRWYAAYIADPDWRAATLFSLEIASATTIAATLIGTLASLAVVRGTLPGRGTLQALAMAPMIVPHIVFGVALYLVFAPIGLTGNFAGFVVAHSVLSIPYVVITVTAALERFDPSLELAALSCGATRTRALFAVVVPNIMPSLAAAAIFAFLASFDEATVAFFISDAGGKTISRKVFEDIDFNLTPIIAAVSTLMVAVSLLLMGSVELLKRRRED
ncbi:mannopine transport system permease protein [Rhizobium sp. BK376]|nr:mannopine transport system permease protein [Rhizobium sp. BK376]